ncbi:MAG: phosphopantetheine-binding protein, partial [Pseudomonadota bacterium]
QIAALWIDVLKVPSVEPGDDFFDLGGNSLMAIMIVTRLREHSPDLPMSAIFDAPTVEKLADRIRLDQVNALDESELEKLLDEIEDLDPSELELLVANKNG